MYADDTTLEISSSNPELQTKVQLCMDSLITWFDSNKLSLHPQKTKIMTHGTSSKLEVNFKGTKIESLNRNDTENACKLLGVQIQPSLSWNSQIDSVVDCLKGAVACLA